MKHTMIAYSILSLLSIGCAGPQDPEVSDGGDEDFELEVRVPLGPLEISGNDELLILEWIADLDVLGGMGLVVEKNFTLEFEDGAVFGSGMMNVYGSTERWPGEAPTADSFLYGIEYTELEEEPSINAKNYASTPYEMYIAYEHDTGSGGLSGEATAVFTVETSSVENPVETLGVAVNILR